jgi:hypothetical protein
LVGEHQRVSILTHHQRGQLVSQHGGERYRPALVCLRRAPLQPARLGDRPGDVNPSAQHVEVLNAQRGHLAPPQAGVAQKLDHLALALDGTGQRSYLGVLCVLFVIGWLSSLCSHPDQPMQPTQIGPPLTPVTTTPMTTPFYVPPPSTTPYTPPRAIPHTGPPSPQPISSLAMPLRLCGLPPRQPMRVW